MAFIIFLAFSLLLQGALGAELFCEELPIGMCSFAIASSGKRCLMETPLSGDPEAGYQCRTSEVIVNNMREYIETDECISACGVSRNFVGISSDSLLESQFTSKLCSPQCYNNCPNIVDLYYNLASAEGASLVEMCRTQQNSTRRAMAQLRSSGIAATGPVTSIASAAGPSYVTAFASGPSSATPSASSPTASYSAGDFTFGAAAPAPL